jgi:hypothetical protein
MFQNLKSIFGGVRNAPSSLEPVAKAAGISFAVDRVTPAKDPLWQGTLGESLEIRSNSSILIMPDRDLPALAPEGYRSKPVPGEPRQPSRVDMLLNPETSVARQLAKTTYVHPLVDTVHQAFSDHRPLVLSPDSIWLTIMQGFGHHVHENAEALRSRIVRHGGQMEICIRTKSLEADAWPSIICQFSEQIRENSDPVLHEALMCEFSTTTPTIKTTYEVALMDAYRRYFHYIVDCVCGIPKVTLEGTPDDWQRMRDRLEVLAVFDLSWWTSKVATILDEFIATAKGNPDLKFWRAIYKPKIAYAEKLASGWIADLFPYLFVFQNPNASPWMVSEALRSEAALDKLIGPPVAIRNPILNTERDRWVLAGGDPAAGPRHWGGAIPREKGVPLDEFPSGLSRAPVNIAFLSGESRKAFLIGGFVGVTQHSADNALQPVINWAVVEDNGAGGIEHASAMDASGRQGFS